MSLFIVCVYVCTSYDCTPHLIHSVSIVSLWLIAIQVGDEIYGWEQKQSGAPFQGTVCDLSCDHFQTFYSIVPTVALV